MISCSTTPIPDGELNPPRRFGIVKEYNDIASRVMSENGVPVSCMQHHQLHVKPGYRLMNQLSRTPLFTVSNHHVSGEEPPQIDGDDPNTYHSYFENRYGEQSLFVCRQDTKEAKVYSGDAGWAAFLVVDGQVPGLMLAPDEAVWLSACLLASGSIVPTSPRIPREG